MCQAQKDLDRLRGKLLEIGDQILSRDDEADALTNDELLAKISSHVKHRGDPVMTMYMHSLSLRRRYQRVVETVHTIEASIEEGATLVDLTPARIELNQRLAELPLSLVLEGSELIVKERYRQIHEKGWTPDHDDEHSQGELATAAECYLLELRARKQRGQTVKRPPPAWPWESESWKPSEDEVLNLVTAGALIAAEIDRLLRIKGKEGQSNG